MRLIVQRVKRAAVEIEGRPYSQINHGFLVLLGIEESDSLDDISYLTTKLCGLRIFADQEGKMNLDLKQVNGDVLIVSQFTLHASTKKGNRPSFIKAAKPEKAIPLYVQFISECALLLEKPCKTGLFGADMQISLINDGPVTLFMDSKNKE